jgi:polyisoprenyl-teichoic acid--peptidoglycan teichoic acid transferase
MPPFRPVRRPDSPPRSRRHPALRVLLLCFLLGIALIPVATGAGLYLVLSGTIDVTRLEQLATQALGPLQPEVAQVAIPAPAPEAPPPTPQPDWAGRDRVNVLLLGNDRREGESDVPRTDTIMVLTIDTAGRTAGLLSLPRDLWVNIPGHGFERINSAFEIGEGRKRDGGVELARKTVEELLGVPIHHHVLVGFAGFVRLVDEMGGVVVDVERPIKDDEYPDANYSMRRIFFLPGLQRLNGETALWYARTRHSDSDFGRARRQQQILLALRRQALQREMLPRAPAILSALSDTFKTDFKAHEILALATVAKDVDTSKLTNRVIDESMTTHWVTPSGAQVELPNRPAIRQMVQEVFGAPGPQGTPAPSR